MTTTELGALVPAVGRAKWAFAARRAVRERVVGLSDALATTMPGDLLLVRVDRLGALAGLQLADDGAVCRLAPGDLIVAAAGERLVDGKGVALIATSGVLGHTGGVATGGLNDGLNDGPPVGADGRAATLVTPLGLLADAAGGIVNLAADALLPCALGERTQVIAVFGTGRGAGKTTAAASLAEGLSHAGLCTAAVKATGTDTFGDHSAFDAAGVEHFDFVDAGMAATGAVPLARIRQGFETLVCHAALGGAEAVVVEFGDGIFDADGARVLEGLAPRLRLDGVILAASGRDSAAEGIVALRKNGFEPLCLTGTIARKPVGQREAETALGLPVLTRETLRDAEVARALLARIARAARIGARAGFDRDAPAFAA